ncbi:hypothetical protein PTTG_00962 [Puccinia triticina 1-1 BBBD Race 1]|uniref:Uncharacterized protein n=2 Tax=Puccinia triticina TaxID=208348 RepID=A0A180GUN2_PUCT1|nr:uncharacterized protein PtA15_3A711 [Puccinia triticina]OAV96506.1 hypothetical protein PTTG_00962 [Puccinia triticina 1-1 BBBD Race 1]WAQ83341.1 hypothetical protein PtA15_3A711 [Puccinia triticina]WAR54190.1 hypothetical protein PtB15_3B703 [Puccinia triticina]
MFAGHRPGMYGTAELIASLNRLGTKGGIREHIQNYQLLVINELARVDNVYSSLSDGIVNRPDPLVIFNQVEIRTDLLAQLQSKRFPSLRRQVIALSNALISRTDAQNDPVSKLKLCLKILHKMDPILNKIKFAIACINPGIDPREVTHDRDFKRAKQSIAFRLDLITNLVTQNICALLHSSRLSMELSGHAFAVDDAQKRAELLTLTGRCTGIIDKALDFMNQSELDSIQDEWRAHIKSIDSTLEKFLKFIKRPHPPRPSGQTRPQLSVIVLIRLARIFFAKLLQMSTDKRHFTISTHLNSRELDLFAEINNLFSERIAKLIKAIAQEDNYGDHFEDFMTIEDLIVHLQNPPKKIFFMVDHVFIPVARQTDRPSPKMYYKAWFYQFNSAYRLANQNLQEAFRVNM